MAKSKTPGKTTAKQAPTLSAKDKKVLLALGPDYAEKPDLAVANITHEARELEATLAKLGSRLLATTDLDKNTSADLAARRGRLEAAEARWLTTRAINTPRAVTELRQGGEALKRDAFEALRYFARSDGDVQTQLDRIAEGSGDADLIDDLGKLADLAAANAAPLKKADLPKKPADKLRAAAKALGDAVADRAVDPEAVEAIELRNAAYWHLRELMDAARAAGRYAFRAEPKLLRLFRASVTRAISRRRGKKSATKPQPPPA